MQRKRTGNRDQHGQPRGRGRPAAVPLCAYTLTSAHGTGPTGLSGLPVITTPRHGHRPGYRHRAHRTPPSSGSRRSAGQTPIGQTNNSLTLDAVTSEAETPLRTKRGVTAPNFGSTVNANLSGLRNNGADNDGGLQNEDGPFDTRQRHHGAQHRDLPRRRRGHLRGLRFRDPCRHSGTDQLPERLCPCRWRATLQRLTEDLQSTRAGPFAAPSHPSGPQGTACAGQSVAGIPQPAELQPTNRPMIDQGSAPALTSEEDRWAYASDIPSIHVRITEHCLPSHRTDPSTPCNFHDKNPNRPESSPLS